MTDQHGRSPGAEPEVRRVVRSWLGEDRHEDATRILGTVLNGLDTAPQRRSSGSSWRFQLMNNNFVRYGLAAAAVVVVAVVGFQFLGNSNTGGPGPTPTATPEPTSTPVASAEPSAPADGSVPVGSGFVLWDGSNGVWDGSSSLGIKITVTVPASGWFGEAEGGVLKKTDSADAPDGASLTVFARVNDLLVGFGDLYVYGDPCRWASTTPDTPVTTVDDAIAALSAQPSRDASTPVDVTYGGYTGKDFTLHVPDDADFSNCDEGEFRTLIEGDGPASTRSHEDPGQFDLFTVLDVNGELVIFDVAYYEGTPRSVLDEMAAIMTSAILQYDP